MKMDTREYGLLLSLVVEALLSRGVELNVYA